MNEKIHNNTPRHFTDLKVWKDAHDLYLLTLKDVENFPNTRGSTNEAENWYYKIEGAGWLGSNMIRERVEKLTESRQMLCGLIRSLDG